MTDATANRRDTIRPGAFTAPTIASADDTVITGTKFLPDHDVTVRVVYCVDDVTDYLAFTTDSHGELVAELPISPHSGVLAISASDHRPDPDGECGLLWSNTESIGGPRAR